MTTKVSEAARLLPTVRKLAYGHDFRAAFQACKHRSDGEFGWGAARIYQFGDGSALVYDGRGWTVNPWLN